MSFTWFRVVNDQVVSPTPGRVGSIIVSPDSDNDRADITLYDGESTADPPLLTIRTAAGTTKSINFQPYLETHRGLFIEIGRYVGEVLIQLQWESE